ncbi:MAG: hypothetical protein Q9M43_06125 [Sulfurimonas sp.]|nr:hypothetical protein [Sulfurimonas sp.]
MKIVFIPNLPYTYRDHKRLGVEYFLKNGYDIEVMDVHNILIPGYKDNVKIEYYTFDKHWEPQNIDNIIKSVKKLSENDYIFFYIAGSDAIKLLNQMKINTTAKFITYIGGSIPVSTVYCNYFEKLKTQIKSFIKFFIPKYRLTFDTDYYISGSLKDEMFFSELIGKSTQIVESNSRDYNLCLESSPYQNEKEYCVFLDTDAIDASDYYLYTNNAKKDVSAYINKITIFFKWIEKEYNVEVIIAAHPKSRIYKDKNEIEGIKVVHGKSSELVKGSKLVINEGTTAISYAIFFNKPLVFFTCKEIAFFYKHCCSFTKELNKKTIDIDNLNKEEFEQEVHNCLKYEYYKNNYLTYTDSKVNTFEMIEKEIFA